MLRGALLYLSSQQQIFKFVRNNKVANYQVTLKLGLRYEPKA